MSSNFNFAGQQYIKDRLKSGLWSRSRSFGNFSPRGVGIGVTEIFKALWSRSRGNINRLDSESELVKNARTPTATALKFKLKTNAFKYC